MVAQNGSAKVNRGRKHICLQQRCIQVRCLNNIPTFSKILTLSQTDITFRQLLSLYQKRVYLFRTTVSAFKYYHCLKNSFIFSNTCIVSQKHFHFFENLINLSRTMTQIGGKVLRSSSREEKSCSSQIRRFVVVCKETHHIRHHFLGKRRNYTKNYVLLERFM
jgi:hypothetical protein